MTVIYISVDGLHTQARHAHGRGRVEDEPGIELERDRDIRRIKGWYVGDVWILNTRLV